MGVVSECKVDVAALLAAFAWTHSYNWDKEHELHLRRWFVWDSPPARNSNLELTRSKRGHDRRTRFYCYYSNNEQQFIIVIFNLLIHYYCRCWRHRGIRRMEQDEEMSLSSMPSTSSEGSQVVVDKIVATAAGPPTATTTTVQGEVTMVYATAEQIRAVFNNRLVS